MLNRMLRTLSLLLAVTGISLPAFAESPGNGEVVTVSARYLFAPIGFDDNDEISVVIDGYLPSGCYRLVAPEIVINRAANQIVVTPRARYFDKPCVEARIPYWQEVRLGILALGDYKISVPTGGILETMHVAEAATSGPDDFEYAAIDSATVDQQDGSNQSFIKLQGRFTNSCMILKEIRVIDTGKTINVLPILEMENRHDCEAIEVPFRRMLVMPDTVTEGRHLLHVRSLNGQAVNQVFTL